MDNIFTNPFLQGLVGRNLAWRTVVLAPSTAVKLVDGNSSRIALVVMRDGTVDDLTLSPIRVSPPAVLTRVANFNLPVVIHMAVYPVLTQGEWYAVSASGGTIYVCELTQAKLAV
jgi:hypothetical protein